MWVADHHSEQQLQQWADQEPRADRARRLRTIVLAKRSYTAPEIATCTGFSRRMVQKWVERDNAAGLETKSRCGGTSPKSRDTDVKNGASTFSFPCRTTCLIESNERA